jgi:hypothetical protein
MIEDGLLKKFQKCFPVMNVILDEGPITGNTQWGSRIIDDYEIKYEIGSSNITIKSVEKVKE